MAAVILPIKYAAVGAAISLDIGILRWSRHYRGERRKEICRRSCSGSACARNDRAFSSGRIQRL